MKDLKITVPVKIDARIFRDFAFFDTFRMKRQWRSPVMFALIMTAFSLLCLILRQHSEQAVLMATVLLTIGLVLPAVYLLNFSKSIRIQIRKLGLNTPQSVYTVTLTEAPDGIHVVTRNGDTAQYAWDSVYGVYKGKGCTYLYVAKSRAYLLPDKDVADNAETMENLFQNKSLARINAKGGAFGAF